MTAYTYTLADITRMREALRLSKRPHVPRYEPISGCFWSSEAEEIHRRQHNNATQTFAAGLELELRTLMQANVRPEEIEARNVARDAELARALIPGSYWRSRLSGQGADILQLVGVDGRGGVQCLNGQGHSQYYQDIYEFSSFAEPGGDLAADFAQQCTAEAERAAAQLDRERREQLIRDGDKAKGRSVGDHVRQAAAKHRAPPAPPPGSLFQVPGIFLIAGLATVALALALLRLVSVWGQQ